LDLWQVHQKQRAADCLALREVASGNSLQSVFSYRMLELVPPVRHLFG
jgi:hypothetical protein